MAKIDLFLFILNPLRILFFFHSFVIGCIYYHQFVFFNFRPLSLTSSEDPFRCFFITSIFHIISSPFILDNFRVLTNDDLRTQKVPKKLLCFKWKSLKTIFEPPFNLATQRYCLRTYCKLKQLYQDPDTVCEIKSRRLC